jgi:peptidoglycan-associated lipoprotein
MKKVLLLAVVLASSMVLGACSSMKSKSGAGEGANGAQTSGVGVGGNNFGDENSVAANKLKAPYDQVYYFDYDKFEVAQDDVASINAQANYLVAHSEAKIRLEGNADDRGSREYNVALGWKRAKAAAEVLEQQGVSAKQIVMVSYGKEKPVALGQDEESYRLNRRVNLVYEAK